MDAQPTVFPYNRVCLFLRMYYGSITIFFDFMKGVVVSKVPYVCVNGNIWLSLSLSRYIDHEAEVDEDVSDDDEAELDNLYNR